MIPFWGILLLIFADIFCGLMVYTIFSDEEDFIKFNRFKKPYRIILRVLFIIFWLPYIVVAIFWGTLCVTWDAICSVFE